MILLDELGTSLNTHVQANPFFRKIRKNAAAVASNLSNEQWFRQLHPNQLGDERVDHEGNNSIEHEFPCFRALIINRWACQVVNHGTDAHQKHETMIVDRPSAKAVVDIVLIELQNGDNFLLIRGENSAPNNRKDGAIDNQLARNKSINKG
jgi:hypothetical protein